MKVVHGGIGITEAQWTSFVNDAGATLDQFKDPAKEQGEVVVLLTTLKPDIVESPNAAPSAHQSDGEARHTSFLLARADGPSGARAAGAVGCSAPAAGRGRSSPASRSRGWSGPGRGRAEKKS